jgi:hypothetical protein
MKRDESWISVSIFFIDKKGEKLHSGGLNKLIYLLYQFFYPGLFCGGDGHGGGVLLNL